MIKIKNNLAVCIKWFLNSYLQNLILDSNIFDKITCIYIIIKIVGSSMRWLKINLDPIDRSYKLHSWITCILKYTSI